MWVGAVRMSTYMVEKWEGEKQNGSCAVERDGTEEAKAVRNRLTWVAFLPLRLRMTSRPGLLPRIMSGL